MAANLKLYARMLAHQQNRAIRYATHQHIALKDDALILNFLAMAGEGDTMHIASLGRLGQPPEIRCVPDPRIRVQQHRLYRWLAGKLDLYFQWCLKHGTYPQVWVPNHGAIHHLGHIADAIRWRRHAPDVQRLADYLSHLVYRAEVAGQQTLMSASHVLAEHFATPQSPSDDEHLGAMLCWIEGPCVLPTKVLVSKAEQHPAGVKTRPDFDEQTLVPLVSAFNQARRDGDQIKGNDLARRIRAALEPIVSRIHGLTSQAMTILNDAKLPVLTDLEAMEECEAREFEFFMSGLTGSEPYRPRATDSVHQAIYSLTKREQAQESLEASLVQGDDFARQQARLSGSLIVGEVLNNEITRVGGRRCHQFNIYTEQHVLSVRPGDEVHRLDDPRFVVRIESMCTHDKGGTILTCRLLKGQRLFGCPDEGTTLELFGSQARWNSFGLPMGQIKKRLSRGHWLHRRDHLPSTTPLPHRPTNLRDLVENLS